MIRYIKEIFATYKGAALFSIYSFVNSGFNFILLLIIARLLTTSDYGQLNLYNILVTLLGFFISLNSTGYISVVFFNKDKIYISKLINVVLTITSVVFGVLLVFSLLAINNGFVLGISLKFVVIAELVCFLQIFSTIVLDIWRLEEKVKEYGLFSCLTVVSRTILTIILIVCFRENWSSFPIAQLFVTLVAAIFAIYILSRKGYIKKNLMTRKDYKGVLSFGVPLIPHSISSWVRQGFDRYIINIYYPLSVVGEYSLAFNIANIIHIVGFAFNSYNSVFIFKELTRAYVSGNEEVIREKLNKQTKQIVVFFTIITVLGVVVSYFLSPYLFPQYKISLNVLIPLCFSSMFQSIYYLFVNYLFYFKKTKMLMYISLSISVIHVVLSLLLTKYSISYAALITLFSNMLITFCVYSYSQKLYPLKCNKISVV